MRRENRAVSSAAPASLPTNSFLRLQLRHDSSGLFARASAGDDVQHVCAHRLSCRPTIKPFSKRIPVVDSPLKISSNHSLLHGTQQMGLETDLLLLFVCAR